MKLTKRNIIKYCMKILIMAAFVSGISLSYKCNTDAATMKLSKTELTLTKGSSKKLKIKNLPASNPKVSWSTSNKYAVKVTKKGKVKAVNYGSAVIKAVCRKKTFTCTVTVPDSSRMVTLNTETVTLEENASYQLRATSKKKVKYHSENTQIAKVTSKGIIKGINPGTTVITAKTKNGYAQCTVTVTTADKTATSESWISDKSVTAIRRLTKNNNFVYDEISWAKDKTITFKIDNLNESNVKKCVWSVSDTSIMSKPEKSEECKIQSEANTLSEGTVTITAVVTDYSGNTTTYTNYVYVTDPKVNVTSMTLLGTSAGNNRQQYISFSGLSAYSDITWTNSSDTIASLTSYNTKAAVWGQQEGSGTVTACVDGKKFTVTYTVKNPVFGEITSVLAQGKKTQINISGIEGITPTYSVRNKKIATVDSSGYVTGVKSGVTYVDVKIGTMRFSYRIEVAAKGMKKIIKRATYIVNNWIYSQSKRMKSGYYDCSALVWKGYKAYKNYQKKLGNATYALPAASLFDYLNEENKIVYYGYTGIDDLQPGDLIFYGDYESAVKYSTPGRTLDIYHVSMYAGNGMVVEKGGQTIEYNEITHIVGIGRVIN